MTDAQREEAAAVRAVHARVEAGHGEDRGLGADILDAVDAPRTMGDPTCQVDAAMALARWLKQDPVHVVASVLRTKQPQCTPEQLARQLCATVLRVHLAKLEKAPS